MPEIQMQQPVKAVGLLRVLNNQQLDDIERAEKAAQKAEEEQNKPELMGLAQHVNTAWQAALRARQGGKIEERLLKSLRQREGEYDPEDLTEIRKYGGSEVYMMLTNIKCRAASAWIRDVVIPPGEKPWSIEPTPEPELPPQELDNIIERVKQEAMQAMMMAGPEVITVEAITDRLLDLRAELAEQVKEQANAATAEFEQRIEDELVEGKFYESLSQFIIDLVTFPTAFLKGPLVRRKKKLTWTTDREGNYVPAIDMKFVRQYERRSPFGIYPSPGAKHIQDGYLCEYHHQLRRSDIVSMKGVPGFSDEAIDAVMTHFGTKGFRMHLAIDQERAEAEDRPQEWDDPDPGIDAIEYWGSATGALLREWGMTKEQVPDVTQDYQITCWLIDRWIVMARINPHPLGHRPYYSSSYDKINDSIWGKCPPELMRDIQKVCNALARALINNLSIASGPMVEVFMDRLMAGEDPEDMYPWKVFKTKHDPQHGKPAVQFYQPNAITEILLRVYEYFFQQASEQSGIPNYIYGSQKVGGAGKTASGLSMLMNAATKTLKGVISHIDEDIIAPIIWEHWLHVMLYDRDVLKVGDINIVTRASEYLIIQEQLQLRRTEFLRDTNNPIDLQIMGLEGRASILRETAKGLKIAKVVPTEDEFERRLQQARPPPNPSQPPGGPGGLVGGPAQTPNSPPTLPSGEQQGGEQWRMAA
jgi:hypothetical protein